jgi:hypothetical protein
MRWVGHIGNWRNDSPAACGSTLKWTVQLSAFIILTYLLVHSMEQIPPWEANRFATSQEIARIYGTWRFITAFTSGRHLSLSWARSVQSVPTSWISFLILSTQLTPWSSKWPLSLRFPHKNPVYASTLPHTRYMPRPSHSRFYHPNSIGWGVQISKFRSPVTSSVLDQNILLSTLLSLSLHASLSVSDQVSHPYKTTGKIVFFNLYIFGYQSVRRNILHRMIASSPSLKSALNFFLNRILIRWGCSKILELFHFERNHYQSLYCDSPSILISKHDPVLSFICICFLSDLLTSN